MKRIKLKDRKLPVYTKGEELSNTLSHIAGGVFGVAALVLCVVFAAMHRDAWAIASGAVYGATMILLYSMSSIYHGMKKEMPKKVFQVIDHCTIYFLIAGSYTPILLTGLREYSPAIAWTLFGIVWALSIFAISLTAIDLRRYRVFSSFCYIAIGWCVIFAIKPMLAAYPARFMWWLVAGGVSYTAGSIFCAIGRKVPYMHFVFHLFVLLGSVLHFFAILFYCM